MDEELAIQSTRHWVETVVVGLDLCPFAKRELVRNSVRFVATQATSKHDLLSALQFELELLDNDSSVETTLLVHPDVLQDFDTYNQFLNDADALLVQMNLRGTFQVASFHPLYQFSGTEVDDAENYSNRSPFPMLHLIREESITRAVAEYPNVHQIPERNIERLQNMGAEKLSVLLRACYPAD